MSDERSKEPTGQDSAPSNSPASATDVADPQARMDLPAWGQGKSKRRRQEPVSEQAAAVAEGVPSFEAVDRGVAKLGKPMFNNVYLVVGGLIAVAGIIAGVQYLRGQGQEENAVQTRALAKGLAPMARGRVVPEDQEMPKDASDPLARTRKELQDQAKTALQGAAGAKGEAGASAQLAKASLAMRQGDAKAAAAGFAAFLAAAGPEHPMRALAQENHALALEQSGDLQGALTQLDALPSPRSARQSWHRGRILLALGKKDEAKAALEKASGQPQAGLEARLAKSLLGKMGAPAGSTP